MNEDCCWRKSVFLKPCREADSMLIQLPDLRQKSNHDCGIAALSCVLSYFGIAVPKGKALGCTSIDGTDPRTVESLLRQFSLSVQSGSMNLEDLKHHTRQGRPVLTLVTTSSGVGHWVVVSGLERGKVNYQDPSEGPSIKSYDEWSDWWYDRDRCGCEYLQWGIAAWIA